MSRFRIRPWPIVALLALLPAAPHAQTGGSFRIAQAAVANGGGVALGGPYRLAGTIALVAAGPVPGGQMTGGAFRLRGGFWPADEGVAGDALFADGFE